MIAAVIVAAGQGVRMGSSRRKQYLHLGGQSILARTLRAFDQCSEIDRIVVAVPAADISYCRDDLVQQLCMRAHTEVVAGGPRRQDSVYNALETLTDDGIVLVHDGVRPLVSRSLIDACIRGAQQWEACIPVMAVVDTLKRIDLQKGLIEETVPRENLHTAQTPQGFRTSLIKEAHRTARRMGWEATDDASLVERTGGHVHIIDGSPVNIKITTPEDLRWAEVLCDLMQSGL